VQKDVYSAFSHFLAKEIVAAYDRKKPAGSEVRDAVTALRNWNGQMEKQTAAPLVATLVYRQLRKRIAERASPGNSRLYESQMAPAIVLDILINPLGWFHDKNEMLMSVLADAVAEGRQMQGGDLKHWDYGKYNELTIRHPVGGQLPLVGAYFNAGPVDMSGSPTTIKQINEGLGPSMRFVADFSNWDQSLNNITTGESGQILSRHYKDQWDAYYYGRSFPMQFQHIDVRSTLVVEAR
jgi:penicillin amidase